MTVPVVSVLAFIPSFLMAEAIRVRLLSLICIVNLLTSAYVLAIVPVSYTTNDKQPYKSPALGDVQNPPWRMYVEYANVFLSIVLSANAYVFKDRPGVYGSFWLLCFLPAGQLPNPRRHFHCPNPYVACSGLVSLAKHLMTSVDIGELEKLKYLYKGA